MHLASNYIFSSASTTYDSRLNYPSSAGSLDSAMVQELRLMRGLRRERGWLRKCLVTCMFQIVKAKRHSPTLETHLASAVQTGEVCATISVYVYSASHQPWPLQFQRWAADGPWTASRIQAQAQLNTVLWIHTASLSSLLCLRELLLCR